MLASQYDSLPVAESEDGVEEVLVPMLRPQADVCFHQTCPGLDSFNYRKIVGCRGGIICVHRLEQIALDLRDANNRRYLRMELDKYVRHHSGMNLTPDECAHVVWMVVDRSGGRGVQDAESEGP